MEITNCTTDKAKRDALLVKDALENGSQKAYSDLMRYYRDPLYFTLLKMMKNPYDAEDLTIEAFGKAFKNLEKYTTDYAFSTWLFKIAINNCIDYMRRKNTSPQCVDESHAVARGDRDAERTRRNDALGSSTTPS